MFHITCKSQNGVVKSFFPISTRIATRVSQWLAARSGSGARLGAPALPGTAERGSAGDRRREAWAPTGLAGRGKGRGRPRGALPGTARAGPPLRRAGSGPGVRVRVQGPPDESSRWGAAAVGRREGGRKNAGRAGPGGRDARRKPSHLRRRLRVRPLCAEDVRPRVASFETNAGGWGGGGRLTREPTEDGGRREGSASEGGWRREGGERRARPRLLSGLELASVAAPRPRAHSQLSHDCSGARPRPKSKALDQ